MTGKASEQQLEEIRQKFIRDYKVTPAKADYATLLQMIRDEFAAGLTTMVEPFPETDKQFLALVDQLRQLDPDQLREKLIESGWLLTPYGPDEMRCQECMYFLVHKRWCDLPELALPAEPDWYCRLWRI